MKEKDSKSQPQNFEINALLLLSLSHHVLHVSYMMQTPKHTRTCKIDVVSVSIQCRVVLMSMQQDLNITQMVKPCLYLISIHNFILNTNWAWIKLNYTKTSQSMFSYHI